MKRVVFVSVKKKKKTLLFAL